MPPDEEVCVHIWRQRRIVQRMFTAHTSAEDILQDACAGYIEAARRRPIDSPFEYAWGILWRQINSAMRDAQLERRHDDASVLAERPHPAPDPERQAIAREARRNALAIVRVVDEVVWRGYVAGESRDETCAALGITETQYNLRKSRGKAAAVGRYQRRYGAT